MDKIMRNSREIGKMAIKADENSGEIRDSCDTLALIEAPPLESQWSTKFLELRGSLQTLLRRKIREIDLSELPETKAETSTAAAHFSKSHCDEVPEAFLPLLAKLAEGSVLTLSRLTEKVHGALFPGKCVGKDILAAPTEDCPVSMLTVRGALLKAGTRVNLGFKRFFGKNANESEEMECGWRWRMKTEYLKELSADVQSDLKKTRARAILKSQQLKAYHCALKYMSESPPNNSKILRALDCVNKADLRIEQNENKSKPKKITTKKPKTEKNTADDKKTPKENIFNYFALTHCSPAKKPKTAEVGEKSLSKWYSPWQPPENASVKTAKKPFLSPDAFGAEIGQKARPNISEGAFPQPKNRRNSRRKRVVFLSFFEDQRPPYFGTFRRKALELNGRRALRRAEPALNYAFDSEAEWGEEPTDAEALSSLDEAMSADENEGEFLQDDFLEPESSDLSKAKRPRDWAKELIPKITIFPKTAQKSAETAQNGPETGPTPPEEKAVRLKRRFAPQFLEPLDGVASENGCVFAEPFDEEFCSLKKGDFLFDVIMSDFSRVSKTPITMSEITIISEIEKQVERLTRKFSAADANEAPPDINGLFRATPAAVGWGEEAKRGPRSGMTM